MCNRLNAILSTIDTSKGDEPMTRTEVINILKATGEDMERQSQKINEVNDKVDKLESKVDEMQRTQGVILEMVQSISKKLDDDKIEEKAYLGEKILKVITNWKFWVVILPTIMLAGAGVLKVLDKSDDIKTISEAIKK